MTGAIFKVNRGKTKRTRKIKNKVCEKGKREKEQEESGEEENGQRNKEQNI